MTGDLLLYAIHHLAKNNLLSTLGLNLRKVLKSPLPVVDAFGVLGMHEQSLARPKPASKLWT